MLIDISIGELVDRTTILHIKTERIIDEQKRNICLLEFSNYTSALAKVGLSPESDSYLTLKIINEELWELEDKIRKYEAEEYFGVQFIECARSIYKTNDKRFICKQKIDISNGHVVGEVKEYNN